MKRKSVYLSDVDTDAQPGTAVTICKNGEKLGQGLSVNRRL